MFNVFARTKAYKDLSGTDFEKQVSGNRNAVVLDVRTRGEFESGKIPGALNIDLMNADFNKRIEALDPSKTYLVYCRSGNRSAQACQIMGARGLEAYNLAGGIFSWRGKVE